MGVCTSRATGLYVASEESIAVFGRLGRAGQRAVINCQGSHSLASSILSGEGWPRAQALAARGFTFVEGDLSQTASQGTFGNDTARTRVGQLRTFVQGTTSPLPASGKVHLMGGSGGATAAINYARANPSNVASMYLIAPLTDLQDFWDNRTDVTVTRAELAKAYNGGVDDGGTAFLAAVATHSPIASGNQAALSGIPIRIAYSTDDPYIPVATVTAYVDAVNTAGGSAAAYSQGAVGHSGTGVDPQDVVDFFLAHP